MKKILALAIVIVMAVSLFAGCSSSDSSSDTGAKLSDVLTQINEKYPDAVKNLKEIKSKSDITRYYDIEEKEIEDFAAENIKDSSQAALEIVIVKAKDSTAAKSVEQKLTVRYNAILSQYASYSAEQLKLAKDGGVESDGNYVYLVVAENSGDIMDMIKDSVN